MEDRALVTGGGDFVDNIHEVRPRKTLARISQAARRVARQHSLSTYHATLRPNTIKRHRGDLQVFANYLQDIGEQIDADDLMYDMRTWEGVNEGLVEGFKRWQVQNGYAVGSVNVRTSTVKKYCEIAANAGFVDSADLGLIKVVHTFRGKEGRNIDENRTVTRVGNKKKNPTIINNEQREALLNQEDSRDALLMYLLILLGFRVGEVSALEVSELDLDAGYIHLYRYKSDLEQTHALLWGGVELFRCYLAEYKPTGKVFYGEPKELDDGSISTEYTIRAIQKRVKTLGLRVGVEQLSPHDLRHDFATQMARAKTDVKSMQVALGHSSPYMALRYVEANKIANEGVKHENTGRNRENVKGLRTRHPA